MSLIPQTLIASMLTPQEFGSYYSVGQNALINPLVLVSVFIGGMVAFLFCGLTVQAVGREPGSMVEEVRTQFREFNLHGTVKTITSVVSSFLRLARREKHRSSSMCLFCIHC